MAANTASLIKKIEALPPECIAEIEEFVDSVAQRPSERALTRAAARLSAPAFAEIWSNPDDAAYEAL